MIIKEVLIVIVNIYLTEISINITLNVVKLKTFWWNSSVFCSVHLFVCSRNHHVFFSETPTPNLADTANPCESTSWTAPALSLEEITGLHVVCLFLMMGTSMKMILMRVILWEKVIVSPLVQLQNWTLYQKKIFCLTLQALCAEHIWNMGVSHVQNFSNKTCLFHL